MLELSFLKRVVMDHYHFVIIILTDWKSLGISIDLMGEEFTECSVSFNIRYRPKKRLLLGFVLQCNHEQLIVTVWVGEFDASAC